MPYVWHYFFMPEPGKELLSSVEVLENLGVQPVGDLVTRNKFVTGTVSDGTSDFFLKLVREGVPLTAREDLANEVRWDQYSGPQLAKSGFRVPEVIAADTGQGWALFEHLDGVPFTEKDLPQCVGIFALLAVKICDIPLGREPADLSAWYTGRLARFRPHLQAGFLEDTTLSRLDALIDGSTDISVLTAGIIHGDPNLKNGLKEEDAASGFGVVDAEFGTTPDKPEWDKPRYHDIAHFYHLLLCQYQDAAMADQFLGITQSLLARSADFNATTFEQEFQLSLLERTISMANHFVLNPNPDKVIDDARRTEPQPYVDIIERSLSTIT
jgi:hypothetical protein